MTGIIHCNTKKIVHLIYTKQILQIFCMITLPISITKYGHKVIANTGNETDRHSYRTLKFVSKHKT